MQRRLVQGWAQAGELLDELRRMAWPARLLKTPNAPLTDMLQLGGMLPSDPARAGTSGLVEMQRLFASLLRRGVR